MRPIVVRSALLFLLGAIAWAGCGDPLSLLPPVFENQEDTLRLYAASRTPVPLPSGFIVSQRTTVRLDQANTFDFLYDVNNAGERFFVPLAAMANTGRTNGNAGFLLTDVPFSAITVALQQGYVSSDTVHIRVGDVFYVRSAVDASCGLGIPYYAKLQVLGFDDAALAVVFRIVTNINCGYRGLELGLPKK